MPNYRRSRITGGTYFFTLVTHCRRPILTSTLGLLCLRSAWRFATDRHPVRTLAVVVLPDHLHCVWRLPFGDADYSTRWRSLKAAFTRRYRAATGAGAPRSPSRIRRREAAVWQRRFWEHTIRDEEDLRRHVDYIHYNPVKHGHVAAPRDWRWSSFHRYVRQGWYGPRWGESEPEGLELGRTVGE